MSLNRVILVGRLTKDPDLRYTPNGVAVATFTLAVNRAFANQQGEREADFINCVIWRKQAENVANYLRKGSLAGVDGRLQTRNYEGQDGKRVYVTEVLAESVQFLEPRNSGRGEQRNSPNQQPVGASFGNEGSSSFRQSGNQGNSGFTKNEDPFSNVGNPIDISDDDLPF
ncbi:MULTISPECIES: single-stranded DNA-binding protein [Bacillus]|jgi:single-strand DNA-binding protein|uniref:single-stranded DNA-binding protein n=1 Tax=Bacillus TaxID=1386 RepID=UPI000BF1C5C3|nr:MULTISPECIES: single-stranded DNA-binding protein [Bacillus]MED0952028.1 single-stranded DNA-binding protein [Bacillus mobilis]PEK84787.1 single-stranded DNA-binding protein [Bacillus toyonensis]